MSWTANATTINQSMLTEFGETFSYLAPGDVTGTPFTAVRSERNPLENEQLAAYERLWTRYSQFSTTPVTGWTVMDGTTQYLVMLVKQDPRDTTGDSVFLYLNKL